MVEASLKAGKTAFKQGDYESAIAHFQAVLDTELDPIRVQNAYKGLVAAYGRMGQWEQAIALCQQLNQTPDEYPWAAKTLQDLTRRSQQVQSETDTFTPTDSPPSPENPPPEQRPLPAPAQQPVPGSPSVFLSGRAWRNAERAQRWKTMRKPKAWRFWLRQAITVFVFYWVIKESLIVSFDVLNRIIIYTPFIPFPPIPILDQDITQTVMGLMILAACLSPWFFAWILRAFYKCEPYKFTELSRQFPETAQVLRRFSKQNNLPLPTLQKLSIGAPAIFAYGNLPRNACIVVSEAILEQLSDEELATLFAAHFGQIVKRDFILMSGAMAFLQLPYLLYWQLSHYGEQWADGLPRKFPNWCKVGIRGMSGTLAALFYGYYWLWRVPLLYFSRYRQYYSDRIAAEFTGNPNALTRALLKMTVGMARHIEQREQTIWVLESCDILMPVGHRQALSLGSLPDTTPFSQVLKWECTNPYRQWLAVMNPHPLIGDRIYLLNRYANFWQLSPEIDLPPVIPPPQTWKERLIKLKNSYTALPILQSAVLSGLFFGIASRLILFLLGLASEIISRTVWSPVWRFIWFYNASLFLDACILAAFSLSIIIWINGYFPDIRIYPSRKNPRLEDLLANPKAVPPRSVGISLTGKLIGRQGLSNWSAQDLMLKTSTGTIKLHFFSKLGPLGNLFPRPPRPETFINQEVTITGWFRRGGIPWIDVDIIRTQNKQGTRSGYPVWVTILAIVAAMWSAYIISQA